MGICNKDELEERAVSNAAFDLLFASIDELISFAREYFAVDFPNPDRAHCPPLETWSLIVRSGKPPKGRVRKHLFSCSECFNDLDRVKDRSISQMEPPRGDG